MKILKKTRTRKSFDVKQATEILQKYGIVHNEKKTRDLINKGRLNADKPMVNGVRANPNDRRAGYVMSEKDLYELIIAEIPIMEEMFAALEEYEKLKKEPVNK